MAAATSHEVICYWPDTAEPVADRARRAVQAALAVLAQYDVDYKNAGAECAIKIGVGVGSLSFVHLGGVANRLQVVACGPASDQAFKAAREAKPGEVACSADTWKAIGKAFKPSRKAAGGVKTVQRGASGAALAPKPLDRHFLKLDPSVIEEAEIEWSTTCYMPQVLLPSTPPAPTASDPTTQLHGVGVRPSAACDHVDALHARGMAPRRAAPSRLLPASCPHRTHTCPCRHPVVALAYDLLTIARGFGAVRWLQSVAQSFSQLHEHQEFWSNEKRHVTMLFINPNIDQSVVLGAAARAFCWA